MTEFLAVWRSLGAFALPLFAVAWIAFSVAASTAFELRRLGVAPSASLVAGVRIRLRLLATCAASAPLLGLLGTVWGLVSVFGALDPEASAAEALGHGLRLALVTTEAGLAVSIPALAAHAWLARRLARRSAALGIRA